MIVKVPRSTVAAPLENRLAFCPILARMTRRQSLKTGFKFAESLKDRCLPVWLK
jgi:hypothetical protein